MEQLLLEMFANLPNFAGFLLLYVQMREINLRLQGTIEKLIDFLIETRGLDPGEIHEHMTNS